MEKLQKEMQVGNWQELHKNVKQCQEEVASTRSSLVKLLEELKMHLASSTAATTSGAKE